MTGSYRSLRPAIPELARKSPTFFHRNIVRNLETTDFKSTQNSNVPPLRTERTERCREHRTAKSDGRWPQVESKRGNRHKTRGSLFSVGPTRNGTVLGTCLHWTKQSIPRHVPTPVPPSRYESRTRNRSCRRGSHSLERWLKRSRRGLCWFDRK
jgi:hypothetical protein